MVIRTCTSRKWDITGIPCIHACATMYDMAAHGQSVGQPKEWVHPCYKMVTWKEMYKFKIDPINGRDMWPRSRCPTTLPAPKHHKQVGRPKKKRIRAADEIASQASTNLHKLPRKYTTVTCSKCHNKGQNSRSCKGQGSPSQGGPSQGGPSQGGPTQAGQSQAGQSGGGRGQSGRGQSPGGRGKGGQSQRGRGQRGRGKAVTTGGGRSQGGTSQGASGKGGRSHGGRGRSGRVQGGRGQRGRGIGVTTQQCGVSGSGGGEWAAF